MKYDSAQDTKEHIENVRKLLQQIRANLEVRAAEHDRSKLDSPEKEIFDEFTPLLKELTYGSSEYKQALLDMGPALSHHYSVNSHHPEYFMTPVDENIDKIDAYLEDLKADDPAKVWLKAYRDELESRVNKMSLLDVIEMLADWKAAGMRHKNGNFAESLEINHSRFKISDQLQSILINTAVELGWL